MNVGIGGCAPPLLNTQKISELFQMVGLGLLFVKNYQNEAVFRFISYISALAYVGSNRGYESCNHTQYLMIVIRVQLASSLLSGLPPIIEQYS